METETKAGAAEKKIRKRADVPKIIRGAGAAVLCIFMICLPFISRYHEEPLTELTAKYFSSSSGYITDWFLYYKEIACIVCGLTVSALILAEVLTGKSRGRIPLLEKSNRPALILCGIYWVLLIISGLAAKHKEAVLLGMLKQYEGLLGVTAYLMLFLAAVNFFTKQNSRDLLTYAVLILSLFAGFWGVMEFFGYPLQETELMARLMSDSEHLAAARSLHSTSSNVHITFFNSNYFGGFCALMFPVTAAGALGCKEIGPKLMGLFAAALIACGAVLSNSSGGLYSVIGGGAMLAVVYIIYIARGLVNRKKAAAAFGVIAAAAVIGLGAALSDGAVRDRVRTVLENGGSEKLTREERLEKLSRDHFVLADVRAEKNELIMTDHAGSTVRVRAEDDGTGLTEVSYFDLSGRELETYEKDGYTFFKEPGLKNLSFKLSVSDRLYCELGYKAKLIFDVSGGRFRPFVHGSYTMEKINSYSGPEFFRTRLNMATGRGFIWGSTLSFIDKCLFIGVGSGNFVTVFPQYDLVSLLEVYKTPAMVVNKPHSWYLGIAADSGVLSLCAVLILLGIFLVRGFRSCVLCPVKDGSLHLRLGLYVSVIAFMAVGISNDSYPCVSPVFWVLFGAAWSAVSEKKKV